MSSITLNEVTKSYGSVQVIRKFSSVFRDREFVTLLGPSGCGKTTMLRMIAGFEKPTSGEILIDDAVVSGRGQFVPPNRRNIGMVFQSYAVWPHMDVFDNVAYPLKIQGLSRGEIKKRVFDILEAVHLTQYVKRLPNELSGGQQQRVALGRALVCNPRVLLLDEPLSNLDAKLRESMRFEIKDMQRRFGITVVYVTHDQTEAMAMSDRVIVFNKGAVQQMDTPTNIYRRPANQFVADFVGKINFIRGAASDGRVDFPGGQWMAYGGERRGPVVVAVRPENMVMRRDRGVLKGTLAKAYYLGDTNDCRVRIGDADVRVIAAGHTYGQIPEGEELWLDFDEYLVFEDDGADQTRILS
ncbi:ABC transporter, ATP-binding protein [Pyramidobacter piscolens W5455]|uniref:ABC transporter, ATP-binding protein n=1 Tax=Pyramidobacter piscolens W5455 TaxID=352165 RepID=A0ABP2HV37_9BACT|nr:ABC transporter ATP-binding protein [Pyramidobacter piscolens]EFB90015.1 ABC transporter, ATP-binding protein [Pyramidobacter piscolens W5455]BDF77373.1 iron ABC transporter ATP-binding protein [Pyramidobacter piscolens]